MAKIYQFPELQTINQPPCATCRTWSLSDRELKKLYEYYALYVATSDDYLARSILHASADCEPSPIKIAAAWQLGSIHYSAKKLRTIFESTYQNLNQIRFMLMDFIANEKKSTPEDSNSTSSVHTYGLKKMRAYTSFKGLCIEARSCEVDEYWLDKRTTYSSFSQALLKNLIQDGLCTGSILSDRSY